MYNHASCEEAAAKVESRSRRRAEMLQTAMARMTRVCSQAGWCTCLRSHSIRKWFCHAKATRVCRPSTLRSGWEDRKIRRPP